MTDKDKILSKISEKCLICGIKAYGKSYLFINHVDKAHQKTPRQYLRCLNENKFKDFVFRKSNISFWRPTDNLKDDFVIINQLYFLASSFREEFISELYRRGILLNGKWRNTYEGQKAYDMIRTLASSGRR